MVKLAAPASVNYAAQIVKIPALINLPGLDNLVGVPVLGHQALTQKSGAAVGELKIAFTAETQLSCDYAHHNNLYRHSELNADQTETGYLEDNRRIRAIRLRGHVSNALLMPLESVAFAFKGDYGLQEGDTFDTLNGIEICRKYEVAQKHKQGPAKSKIEKAFKRVDSKMFPEHLDTDQYWRSKHLLCAGREVVIKQKLHGTSWRGGRVPVLRTLKWYEKLLKKFGVNIPLYEWDVVFGSRKVIKDPNNPNQEHFYDQDLWTDYGQKLADMIPEGYIIYGELVGWTPDGAPIQKGYTYHLKPGECELYVYRVSHINSQGFLSDLSWDGVKDFCRARGLKWTPELFRVPVEDLDELIDNLMDLRYADQVAALGGPNPFADSLPLSDKKTVDEGVVLRQEGLVPVLLKAKSARFLEYESALLDKEVVDIESAA